MLGFTRQAPNCSKAELPLMIVSMSSPTIGNTIVVRSLLYKSSKACFLMVSPLISSK
jgi:hypothetical protein